MGSFDWKALLANSANVAQIVTAAIAVIAGTRFLWRKRRRQKSLEEHLKLVLVADKASGKNGRRTPLRLSADLGFTIEEILDAAFSSKLIERKPSIDRHTRRATAIFLRYKLPGNSD